ncbi:hypothetical protein LXL04_033464 [Taraxacum kok-saghyz]
MAKGRLRCIENSIRLKSKFGTGYIVHINLSPTYHEEVKLFFKYVNVSELGLVTPVGKVVWGKYAHIEMEVANSRTGLIIVWLNAGKYAQVARRGIACFLFGLKKRFTNLERFTNPAAICQFPPSTAHRFPPDPAKETAPASPLILQLWP